MITSCGSSNCKRHGFQNFVNAVSRTFRWFRNLLEFGKYVVLLTAHTHPFKGPLSGLPGWAGTRKVKPIWILLKQETVSGSGISWAICKSEPRSMQITTPAQHCSVFIGRMPFLPPNQQCQSTSTVLLTALTKLLHLCGSSLIPPPGLLPGPRSFSCAVPLFKPCRRLWL